jgi:hypothetical protein
MSDPKLRLPGQLRAGAMLQRPGSVIAEMLEQAAVEIERLQHNEQTLKNALWKASGDDEDCVNSYIESEGGLK